MRSVHKREETKEEKVGFKPRMEKHYERLTVSLGSEHEDKGGKEFTYGTPIHVYAPRMKVIQTWVFRRCTLPQRSTDRCTLHNDVELVCL